MCEPVTIGMAAATAAGAAVSIAGKVQQGRYEQQVAKNNAFLALQQGARLRQRGENVAAAIRSQGAKVGGAARAQMAASGVDTTAGSAGALLAGNEMAAAADAEQARANAAMEAWGLEVEAQSSKAQGRMARRASILGGVSQGIGAAGSILGGAARGFGR